MKSIDNDITTDMVPMHDRLTTIIDLLTSIDDATPTHPNILAIVIDQDTVEDSAVIGQTIGTLSPIGGSSPYIFSIVNDPDNKFIIGGVGVNELRVKNTLDYDTAQSHTVTLQCTDIYFKTFTQALTITVTIGAHTSLNYVRMNNGVSNQYLYSNGLTGSAIDFTNAFSISYWINCGNNTSYSHIVFGPVNWKIGLFNNGTGGNYIRFGIRDESEQYIDAGVGSPTVDWSDNTWRHICICYASSVVRIYFDGTQQSINYFTNQSLGNLKSFSELFIGSRTPGPTAVTNGGFNEITFWDIDLDQDEVSELFGMGFNTNPRTHTQASNYLKAWYPLEGIEDNVVKDNIGTIHLTPINITGADFLSL